MFVHHGDHIVEGAGKIEEDVVDLPTEQREPVLVSQEALAVEPEDTSRGGLHVQQGMPFLGHISNNVIHFLFPDF